MMLAAVYHGGRTLVPEHVPIPQLQPGELLVKVRACGVCGTDIKKILYGLVDPPRVFGHETAGEIAAIGPEVEDYRVGERVALNHHVPCQRDDCYYCTRRAFAQCPVYRRTGTTAGFEPAGGGFAEYVRVMDWCARRGVVRIPAGVSDEEAAFIEPLNTCLKAVKTAGVMPNDTVAVIGLGPIGLLFTLLLRHAGARVVGADRFESRRLFAERCGAVRTVDASGAGAEAKLQDAVREITQGVGADLAIVTAPDSSLISSTLELVRPAGKVLLFAQTRLRDLCKVDAGAICMQEKSLIGSYSSDISLQDDAAELIFSRIIDVRELVTHRFPLAMASEAINVAANPTENSLKVIVTP